METQSTAATKCTVCDDPASEVIGFGQTGLCYTCNCKVLNLMSDKQVVAAQAFEETNGMGSLELSPAYKKATAKFVKAAQV